MYDYAKGGWIIYSDKTTKAALLDWALQTANGYIISTTDLILSSAGNKKVKLRAGNNIGLTVTKDGYVQINNDTEQTDYRFYVNGLSGFTDSVILNKSGTADYGYFLNCDGETVSSLLVTNRGTTTTAGRVCLTLGNTGKAKADDKNSCGVIRMYGVSNSYADIRADLETINKNVDINIPQHSGNVLISNSKDSLESNNTDTTAYVHYIPYYSTANQLVSYNDGFKLAHQKGSTTNGSVG